MITFIYKLMHMQGYTSDASIGPVRALSCIYILQEYFYIANLVL